MPHCEAPGRIKSLSGKEGSKEPNRCDRCPCLVLCMRTLRRKSGLFARSRVSSTAQSRPRPEPMRISRHAMLAFEARAGWHLMHKTMLDKCNDLKQRCLSCTYNEINRFKKTQE